jgi:dynein heavy chain
VREVYGNIVQPKDGVIVHGLFVDAGRWDNEHMILVDPYPGKKFSSFIFFHCNPFIYSSLITTLYHAYVAV